MDSMKLILNHLEENIALFRNISVNDFKLLRGLNVGDLKDNHLVTPLLKQISEYAFVDELIETEERIIICNIFEDFEPFFLFCNTCSLFLEGLAIQGCQHPTVVNFKNARNALLVSDEFFDSVYSLFEEVQVSLFDNEEYVFEESNFVCESNFYTEFLKNLNNFCINVDNIVTCNIEMFFAKLLLSAKQSGISEYEFLLTLIGYTSSKLNLTMLLGEERCAITGSLLTRCVKDEVLNQGIFAASFDATNVMKSVEQLLSNQVDNIGLELKFLRHIVESYNLFKSYQYSKIMYECEEQLLLSKCKKF